MFKGLIEGAKDRFTRAVQLSKTARETGKRNVTPELGVGEFVRGFIDKNLAKSDAEDEKFTTNLKKNIEQNVPEDKKALFDRSSSR